MVEFAFFDAAGTLFHLARPLPYLVAAACKAQGFPVDPWELGILMDVERLDGDPMDPLRLSRRVLTNCGIQEEAVYRRLVADLSSPDTYRLYQDVPDCLFTLRGSGCRLGVISNFGACLRDIVVGLGIADLFELIVASGEEAIEKPAPALYRLAARRAGVATNLAMHIGDSVTHDVEPARQAGMEAVLLDRELVASREGTAVRIRSLDELPRLIASR